MSLILTTGYHWSVARCKFATGAIFAIHWDAAASTGIPRHVAAKALVYYRSKAYYRSNCNKSKILWLHFHVGWSLQVIRRIFFNKS